MTSTVVITGIGGSIGIDVARSLRRDRSLRLVGADANPLGLRQTAALVDATAALPRADREPEAYRDRLCALIADQAADFVFVNPDPELEALAALRASLPCPSSMPAIDTVAVTLDKARTVARVALDDVFPATFELARGAAQEIDGVDDVARAFAALGPPLWIRARVGAGGRGSLAVETPGEARAWMAYWSRRGKDYQWVAQEYLPGANINWTGLYVGGDLVAGAAMERLGYFLGQSAASGVSGQVSRCATVDPARYQELCHRVVRALDQVPHGLYSVDLRHARDVRALVTEVNPRLAGRPWLYTSAGVNLALAAVRALTGGAPGDAIAPGGLAIDVHLHRQLDIEPVICGPGDDPGA